MLQDFKTYQLAVRFHKLCLSLETPKYLRDQLNRASSSIALNIAEGSAKPTAKDQKKFYAIALGSLRECQAIHDLCGKRDVAVEGLANPLGACLHVLTHGRPRGSP